MSEKYVKKLRQIIKELDKNVYPETYETIEEICDCFDFGEYSDPMDIATELHDSDQQEVMHPEVAEIVIRIYLSEIEKGNADAMCDLGTLYYLGRCGEQNYTKAVEYYTMASDAGCDQATENLGYCYYYGRNIPIDYEKAYHCFIKGALAGKLNSVYKIGDMYKNGYYVKKDEALAFILYKRCYMEMDYRDRNYIGADICLRMGNSYFYGKGTERDVKEALRYYQEAERYFYIKISNGDFFAKSGLESVLEKQNEIRKELKGLLPKFDWIN